MISRPGDQPSPLPVQSLVIADLELRQRPGDQPLPHTADPTAPGMHDLAIELLRERKALGLTRYGATLQPLNGRDALQDAIEEAADLLVYLLQVRQERDALTEQRDNLTIPEDQAERRSVPLVPSPRTRDGR